MNWCSDQPHWKGWHRAPFGFKVLLSFSKKLVKAPDRLLLQLEACFKVAAAWSTAFSVELIPPPVLPM
jgi:hypothetical protein